MTRKTALVTGAGLLVLLGVVAALSLTTVMGGYQQLERRLAVRNLERFHEAIENLVANLNTKASDWSNWDDTYEFVAAPEPDYIDSNLSSDSIGLLGLCALVLMDNQGQVVAAVGHNEETSGIAPPDEALMRAIAGSPDLWLPPPAGRSRSGLVRVDDGILAVAIRPILNSHGEGPTNGSIIFAQRLDEEQRERMSTMIRAQVSWQAIGSAERPGTPPALGAPPEVRPHEGRMLAAGVLPDIAGRPALATQISIAREVTAQGRQTVRFFLLAVVATGLLLGLATDRAMRVLVLSRVARLSDELSGIAASGESARRVTAQGRDELGSLAIGVNRVLETLDRQAVELRRARQVAEEATRAKSSFLAAISHDVRSPLAVVLGSAEVLGDASLSEAERREHLTAVARNVRHALAVVGDLLDHSKIEAGRMSLERVEFSPADVVRESAAMVESAARTKGLDLRVRLDAGLPALVAGDPTRLRQILINLLGNAVKFTGSGWIELRAEGHATDTGWVLTFEVQDTGIGLSPEQLSRLFEAYAQAEASTTRMFGGTGLGLSISRSLARQMGGDLTASGRPGAGATFTARIGVERATEAQAAPAGAPGARPTSGALAGLRVLIADDSDDNRRLFVHHLRAAGATVVWADDGKAALDRAAEASGAGFDAIILDIQMPRMNGPEAAARLRTMGYAGRLIGATASEDPSLPRFGGAEVFDRVLVKPVSPADLQDAVRAVCASAARRRAA